MRSEREVRRAVAGYEQEHRGRVGEAGLSSKRVPHPRLRAEVLIRREAAGRVGVYERTAGDWDRDVRRTMNARVHPDDRWVDYSAGRTMTSPPPWISEQLGPRLPSLIEREKIADQRREGKSLRASDRAGAGPARIDDQRVLDAQTVKGRYLPHGAH